MTTRVEGDKHPTLLRDKGGTGFPFLVFLDADGNVLARQGDRSVAGFQKTLKHLQALPGLRKLADAGDQDAAVDLLLAEIGLGSVDLAAAQARIEQIQTRGAIAPGRRKQLDAALIDLEVAGMMGGTRTQQAVAERGTRFLEMMKAGRVPQGQVARSFYLGAMGAAEKAGDAKAYRQGLEALKALLADVKGAETMLARYEETLARLEKGNGGG